MAEDSKLTVVERSRGLANADDNRLRLSRSLWLDFNHGGFTAVDRITGTLRRDWRLDMQAPFASRARDRMANSCSSPKARTARPGSSCASRTSI